MLHPICGDLESLRTHVRPSGAAVLFFFQTPTELGEPLLRLTLFLEVISEMVDKFTDASHGLSLCFCNS